jgi:hypothetical protein
MATAIFPPANFTPDEQTERRRALDSAIASVRMEGMELDPEAREIIERHVRGEITLDEMNSQIDAFLVTI